MKAIVSAGFFALALMGAPSYSIAADGNVKADVVKTRPLEQYRKTAVIMTLEQNDGQRVTLEDLKVTHTEPVHLLIIDPGLSDYHHKHPEPTSMPGEYVFTMTPQTDCGYKIWADLTPVKGKQHFASAKVEGAKECSTARIDKTTNMEFSDSNYRFMLEFDTESLAVGQDTTAKIIVRELGGRYVNELEPVMGAFAHVVGFYDDYKTITHVHPMGAEPKDMKDRGGPTLNFHLHPEQAGFLKLFAQFQINGRPVYASFGVDVKDNSVAEFDDMDWGDQPLEFPSPEPTPVAEDLANDPVFAEDKRRALEESMMQKLEDAKYKEEMERAQTLQNLFKERDQSTDVYEDTESKILQNEKAVAGSDGPARLEVDDPF